MEGWGNKRNGGMEREIKGEVGRWKAKRGGGRRKTEYWKEKGKVRKREEWKSEE